MGEAYWVAGGVTTAEGLAHALEEAGLRITWMEETHLWGVPLAQALPGLAYVWPIPPAPSALWWLQNQVAALRHGGREWCLLVHSGKGQALAWSALASASGVGRYNILPRARLRNLLPWRPQTTLQSWQAWLAQEEVEVAHLRYLVALGGPPALLREEHGSLTVLSVPWPEEPLPAVLTIWSERLEREVPAIALVASQVGNGMIAVSLESI
ncbi:hypothetical protein [uncultured Thermanaerothrix sp.]|uniref:hypothetical protein n=1 Tax=uncultured Thermanaerothrix sp. TaxID=1195149 RepID=UPI0026355295|nr:hypothetical protein [uncultured Thermanaerothrix sp.]